MNDSKISVRYAKALFESTLEKGVLEEARQDMLQLQELSKMGEFQYFLRSPVMKESEKRKLMHDMLMNNVHALTLGLLDLVLKNSRELFIPGIARNFEELYKKHKGIKSAVLVSASAMDDSTREKIGRILKDTLNARVELSTEENSALIGGFVIRIDDQQYDASVSNKLKTIKKQLLN